MTLSQQQIGEAGEATNAAMFNGTISAELRGRLVIDLHAATHAVGDAELIAGARKVRGDTRTNAAYLGALDAYIAILTGSQAAQSTPTQPAAPPAMPPTSANQQTGSTVVAPVPASGTAVRDMRDTVSVLLDDAKIASMEAQGVQVFDSPVQFNGPVGMGGPPLDGHPLVMRKGGEVIALSKVASANTQNKTGDVWRAGSCSIVNEYDNGSRMIRGGFWHNGILHRVQDIIDIYGFDSAGTVSKSHEDYSKPEVERSQDWIVREDFDAKEIVLVACRAGWGARIAASTQTTNNLNENNFDRSVQIIAPLEGAE